MSESKQGVTASVGAKVTRRVILGLLVLFLAATVVTYYQVGVQTEQDKQYISLLGKMQVLSQGLAKDASEAAGGRAEAFTRLGKGKRSFDRHLEVLGKGDASHDLPPLPGALKGKLDDLTKTWHTTEARVDSILRVRDPILALYESVRQFNTYAEEVLLQSDELANVMVETGASPEQVYQATRQLMLMQRIAKNIDRTLKGGEEAVTAADRFGRDADQFTQVVDGLLKGSEQLGIEAVTDSEARETLEAIAKTVHEQTPLLQRILENSVELFQIQEANAAIFAASDELLSSSRSLLTDYNSLVDRRFVTSGLGNLFAGVTILTLVLLGMQITREARQAAEQARQREEEARLREEETKETNRRNQEAILRLLGEISDLADGDLTVTATVTEDFTGAIADAINYSVEEMRGLVSNINRTSVHVASAAQNTRGTAIELSQASEDQARQIEQASAVINRMAEAFEGLSASAADSSDVAKRSVDIASKGGQAVRDTIAGMDSIRETIQETSKRIKRLGESSQEIGDIVGLIDDIADQTNILALNAAIQASMAGEAGRGFAVVADEVQRLAERSSQATRQIERLVKTIQSDTTDAVISMEKSTTGVVEGAQVAESAGEALGEIEAVSHQLAELIQGISVASRDQVSQAQAISALMRGILDITARATTGTNETALSIGKLAELADELRRSVAGFTLPEEALSGEAARQTAPGPAGRPTAGAVA